MYFMRINSNKREKLRTWKLFCLRKNPEEGHSSKPGLPGVNSVKGEEGLVHGRKGRCLCAGISEIQGLMSLTFIRVIITGITALIWRPWHARFYFKHSFKLLIFVSVLRQLHFSLMQPLFHVNPALSQIKKIGLFITSDMFSNYFMCSLKLTLSHTGIYTISVWNWNVFLNRFDFQTN